MQACCGTQHEKETAYGMQVKQMVQQFIKEDSNHVKKYQRLVNAMININANNKQPIGQRQLYDYQDFIISVP